MTALAINERAVVGHNEPPAPTQQEFAAQTFEVLSGWLKETPVIQTEDEARSGKELADRACNSLAGMEAERKSKVSPLNEEVKSINGSYQIFSNPLGNVLDVLKDRLAKFMLVEEAKRAKIAEEKRIAAEQAEAKAREAERLEQEALSNAAAGECVDVGAAVVQADDAYAQFEKADRAADLADSQKHVKIGSRFGRSLGLRKQETLIIENAIAALTALGVTEQIEEAILTSAREFRRNTGKLPNGVIGRVERGL